MGTEKGNFRGRVFGGFHRSDVIGYIEKLAQERNSLQKENEELREKLLELEERLQEEQEAPKPVYEEPESIAEQDDREEAHRRAIEELDNREETLRKAIEDAQRILSDVKAEYDNLCRGIKFNVTQADRELGWVTIKLTGLQRSLQTAGERLEDIGSGLKTGE